MFVRHGFDSENDLLVFEYKTCLFRGGGCVCVHYCKALFCTSKSREKSPRTGSIERADMVLHENCAVSQFNIKSNCLVAVMPVQMLEMSFKCG